jgi:hypothetical protein
MTKCMDAFIFVAPISNLEFHVHMGASNLAIWAMLTQNPTRKCD